MRARQLAALVLGLAIASAPVGCSCAETHQRDDAGHGSHDGGVTPDGANSDVPDDGVCRVRPGLCISDSDCLAWAADVAPPGTVASTTCPPGGGYCTLGVYNCSVHDGVTTCYCAPTTGSVGLGCAGGEICVADAAGGPTRCATQCDGH